MSLHCVLYYFWAGIITDVLFPSVPVCLTVGQRVAIGTAVDQFHMCFLILFLWVFPFVEFLLAHFFLSWFCSLFFYYDTYRKMLPGQDLRMVDSPLEPPERDILLSSALGTRNSEAAPEKVLWLFSSCLTNHLSLPLLMMIMLEGTFPFLLAIFLGGGRWQ